MAQLFQMYTCPKNFKPTNPNNLHNQACSQGFKKGSSEDDAAMTILTITAAHIVSVHTQILDAWNLLIVHVATISSQTFQSEWRWLGEAIRTGSWSRPNSRIEKPHCSQNV